MRPLRRPSRSHCRHIIAVVKTSFSSRGRWHSSLRDAVTDIQAAHAEVFERGGDSGDFFEGHGEIHCLPNDGPPYLIGHVSPNGRIWDVGEFELDLDTPLSDLGSPVMARQRASEVTRGRRNGWRSVSLRSRTRRW